MKEFFENAFSGIAVTDIVDILIVAVVIYYLLKLLVETRAGQIVKGILILVIATLLSDFFNLYTLNWICRNAITLGAVAVIIVLQPELRRVLEVLGRGKLTIGGLKSDEREKSKQIAYEVAEAVAEFSSTRTGALIVFERSTVLEDIAETGTTLEAKVTQQLLGNIFYEGAPLHDGAVIISDSMVYAAGCVLPLSENQDISKSLGTRHRAGLGITENSDALVVIVSEETGIISIARDGTLERFLDRNDVEKTLLDMYFGNGDFSVSGKISKATAGRRFIRVIHRDNSSGRGKNRGKSNAEK